ncbi:MAG: hypothetical protein IT531_00075 [Burkholderiales bacterium]|nr:hypothetical protein [Burkholderiales bacterium]
MPSITFDRFDIGLDRRKGKASSEPNRLRVLTNAYVTTGKQIQKRPALSFVAMLEPGTKGLKAAAGKLNTFYESGTITHANALFAPRKLPHPTLSQAISRIHYCDSFAGYLYAVAEYADGSIWHHYLDDDGAWVAATAYSVGTYRRPVAANGYRYKVTAIAGSGTSGAGEPTWPTTVGATVVDNAGANQITWTCFSSYVQDANCPQRRPTLKAANKIWCAKDDLVRFCAAGSPRDWTSASDAGFLPVGRSQDGSTDALALGQFQRQLVVFFADGAQVWNIDEDPSLNAIHQKIYGIGTRYPQSPASFASDVFFLADAGFRSITVNSQTDNFQDIDVGSPIDSLVAVSGTTPMALYAPGFGQYWCFVGRTAWVYSFSKSAKLAAWSKYIFQVDIDAIAALNNKLYVRSGNDVYEIANGVYSDQATPIEVAIEMAYVDAKQPGILKQFWGADFVGQGTPQLAFRCDSNDESKVTQAYAYTGDTRAGVLHPVEVAAVNIAPVVMHSANEDFRMDALELYFNPLGAM